MMLESYNSFAEAKKEALNRCKGSQKIVPYLRKEYRVYFRHGEHQIWAGREIDDFPSDCGYLFACKLRGGFLPPYSIQCSCR